jgi:hypothetical protein
VGELPVRTGPPDRRPLPVRTGPPEGRPLPVRTGPPEGRPAGSYRAARGAPLQGPLPVHTGQPEGPLLLDLRQIPPPGALWSIPGCLETGLAGIHRIRAWRSVQIDCWDFRMLVFRPYGVYGRNLSATLDEASLPCPSQPRRRSEASGPGRRFSERVRQLGRVLLEVTDYEAREHDLDSHLAPPRVEPPLIPVGRPELRQADDVASDGRLDPVDQLTGRQRSVALDRQGA